MLVYRRGRTRRRPRKVEKAIAIILRLTILAIVLYSAVKVETVFVSMSSELKMLGLIFGFSYLLFSLRRIFSSDRPNRSHHILNWFIAIPFDIKFAVSVAIRECCPKCAGLTISAIWRGREELLTAEFLLMATSIVAALLLLEWLAEQFEKWAQTTGDEPAGGPGDRPVQYWTDTQPPPTRRGGRGKLRNRMRQPQKPEEQPQAREENSGEA